MVRREAGCRRLGRPAWPGKVKSGLLRVAGLLSRPFLCCVGFGQGNGLRRADRVAPVSEKRDEGLQWVLNPSNSGHIIRVNCTAGVIEACSAESLSNKVGLWDHYLNAAVAGGKEHHTKVASEKKDLCQVVASGQEHVGQIVATGECFLSAKVGPGVGHLRAEQLQQECSLALGVAETLSTQPPIIEKITKVSPLIPEGNSPVPDVDLAPPRSLSGTQLPWYPTRAAMTQRRNWGGFPFLRPRNRRHSGPDLKSLLVGSLHDLQCSC
jgi:hypothetical protein